MWGNIPMMVRTGNHRVDVERPGFVTDAIGGRVNTFAVTKGNVRAWVQPARANVIEQYGARDIAVSHSVFFYADPEVRIGDRLLHRGRYLLVRGMKNAGDIDRLWRVDCEETH